MGKSTINGNFLIAMLNYQRVHPMISLLPPTRGVPLFTVIHLTAQNSLAIAGKSSNFCNDPQKFSANRGLSVAVLQSPLELVQSPIHSAHCVGGSLKMLLGIWMSTIEIMHRDPVIYWKKTFSLTPASMNFACTERCRKSFGELDRRHVWSNHAGTRGSGG